jgi:hypothetical protein
MVNEAGSNWKTLKKFTEMMFRQELLAVNFTISKVGMLTDVSYWQTKNATCLQIIQCAFHSCCYTFSIHGVQWKMIKFYQFRTQPWTHPINWLTWWYSRWSYIFPALRPLHGIPRHFNKAWRRRKMSLSI